MQRTNNFFLHGKRCTLAFLCILDMLKSVLGMDKRYKKHTKLLNMQIIFYKQIIVDNGAPPLESRVRRDSNHT